MSGGIVFDLYALGSVAILGGIVGFAGLRMHHRDRPYDWSRDGECDNRSHPRIVS